MVGKWIINVLIGIDQLGNTIVGGDPDETISSRLGKIEKKHGGKVPRWRFFSRFLIWGLDKIDEDHCEDAIEHDEGKDSILDKP